MPGGSIANNLRQLAIGFNMYVIHNKECFPHCGSMTMYDDWIYWEPWRDPNKGRLVPYAGGAFVQRLYTCPSDPTGHRPMTVGGNRYLYSYSVNNRITGLRTSSGWAFKPVRMSEITHPSDKILAIDESSETLDDGCWSVTDYAVNGRNCLSNRHDKDNEAVSNRNYVLTADCSQGNTIMADCHYAYTLRWKSFDPSFYDPRK